MSRPVDAQPAAPGALARKASERGAALLTVLLLVAVIAVLAGTALERLRLATRLGGNAVALDQARAYSFATETLAVVKVSDLLRRSPDKVTLQGGWSGKPFALPIPNGTATATVVDGGNCFNLNSLVTEDRINRGSYSIYGAAQMQFARLIRLVDPTARAPDTIAAATADWIDSDDSPVTGGAEDRDYRGRAQPYRTAGTLMTDPSELRAVLGVTRSDYDKLRPWICTLPVAQPSSLNVNTLLPEQAPLIAMLRPGLSPEAARQVLLQRPALGFATPAAFWNQGALKSETAGSGEEQTAIKTTWFSLSVRVALGGTTLEQTGLLDANALPVRLVSRQWGERS